MEEWKEIEGYGNDNIRYEISNYGKIKLKYNNGKIKYFKGNCRSKYPMISLRLHKGCKHLYIHRLIALHFIPNPKFKPEVNHIDGNKRNYHYTNLEWVTHSENIRHGHKIGISKVSENISMSILTNEQVEYIRDRYKNGIPINEISKTLGIKTNKLRLILKGY
jgi:hypothetical protein